MATVTPLSNEDRNLLASLGLAEGGWPSLYPLPILRVAWLDEELTPEEAEELRGRLGKAGAALLAGATEADFAGAGALVRQHLVAGEANPERQAVLEQASAALCWHMARDLSRKGREDYLKQVRVLAGEVLTGQQLEADAVLEEMALMMDAYIGKEIFEPMKRDDLVTEFSPIELAQRFGSEAEGDWLISPLVHLLDRLGGPVAVKSHLKSVSVGLAGAQPMGLAVLCDELEEWCAGGRRELSEPQALDHLARFLAEMVAADRECVLKSLENAMSRMTMGGLAGFFSKPLLESGAIAEVMDVVRDKVEAVRRGRG
jgi:hypothetical protein